MKQKETNKQELPKIKYYPIYRIEIQNKDRQGITRVILHKY